MEIADVKLFPTFQIMISDFVLLDQGKKIVSLKHLHTGFYPLDLWEGFLHIHSLQLEEVKLFIPNSEEKGASLFSIKELPVKVMIDSLHIEDIAVYENDETIKSPAATVKGSFYIDPQESLIVSLLKIKNLQESDNWITTEIAYEKETGSIQIATVDGTQVHAEFMTASDEILRIHRFHAAYGSYHLDGNVSITYEGDFEDSDIIFTTGELSDKLPIEGYLYGDGKILGSLWSPVIDLKVFSDQLIIKDTIIRDMRAKVSSSQGPSGLSGEIAIAFLKEDVPYEFSGKIFWDESLGPLPTRLITSTNLAKIAQILNIETTDISGDVDIELNFKEDNILVNAALHNGQIESYQMGNTMTEVEGLLVGDINRLDLKVFKAKDGKEGIYSARGFLVVDFAKQFPFELSFSMNKALLFETENKRVTANGKLRLHGNIDKATLEGTLTTQSARMTVRDKESELAESIHVLYINQSSKETPPTPSWVKPPEIPLTLNVKVIVPGKAKLKGKEFTSEWSGEAVITGNVMAPQVHGELKISNGRYSLRGRTLKFEKGSMIFAGDIEKKTSVYVIGEMEIDRYTIEVIVKGPIRNTGITFRSNPPLSRKEILSWILFNKDISDISEFQGGQLNQTITNLSNDKPDILTRIGDALGIDRIDISGGSAGRGGQVSFEVGKYVSENTYISLSRKPNRVFDATRIGNSSLDDDRFDQSNRLGIETSLGKHIKLQAEVDEDQCGQINLLWKKDY